MREPIESFLNHTQVIPSVIRRLTTRRQQIQEAPLAIRLPDRPLVVLPRLQMCQRVASLLCLQALRINLLLQREYLTPDSAVTVYDVKARPSHSSASQVFLSDYGSLLASLKGQDNAAKVYGIHYEYFPKPRCAHTDG